MPPARRPSVTAFTAPRAGPVSATPPLPFSVERRAAEFFGCEASFYFPSGYAGNGILLRAIESNFDALFVDEHSHYCVFEAAAQSGRPLFRFRHRDAGDLADSLRKHLQARPTAAGDDRRRLFGSRNDRPAGLIMSPRLPTTPAPAFWSMTPTASAFWAIAAAERSSISACSTASTRAASIPRCQPPCQKRARVRTIDTKAGPVTFFCATLSKALGGYGGIIPGSHEFIEHVRHASHWYDGATAPAGPGRRRLRPRDRNRPGRSRSADAALGERAAAERRAASDRLRR